MGSWAAKLVADGSMVKAELVPMEQVEKAILVLRGHRVILDADLAQLYGVTTGSLNRAVTRNLERFPADFMLQLTAGELSNLMFQIGTSSWGGTRKPPRAFTEQGVAMLSSVLHSPRAVQVNIEIMRAFVRLRQILGANAELAKKLFRRHPRAHVAASKRGEAHRVPVGRVLAGC
jgi:ORF6N domain